MFKSLVIGLCLFSIGCVEKNLDTSEEGQDTGNSCYFFFATFSDLGATDLTNDFTVAEADVTVAVDGSGKRIFTNTCPVELTISEKQGVARVGNKVQVLKGENILSYDLDGLEIPLTVRSGETVENCTLTYSSRGELREADQALVLIEQYEYDGSGCFQ